MVTSNSRDAYKRGEAMRVIDRWRNSRKNMIWSTGRDSFACYNPGESLLQRKIVRKSTLGTAAKSVGAPRIECGIRIGDGYPKFSLLLSQLT